jgi:hypothetical protein
MQYSRYFRNAFVRANYNNTKLGRTATIAYLDSFFNNLVFGKSNELESRELHIIPNTKQQDIQ